MADKIKVNTGSLDRTKQNVSNLIRQIRSQIAEMRGDLRLLNSMWEGAAHATFDAEFTTDINRLDNLCKSLDGIVNYEGNAVTEYERCEKSVRSLIETIRI